MNQLQPIRFYVILLGFFLAALVAGSLFFLVGMHDASYLVNDGARTYLRYVDKPRYDLHLQGFIYAVSFLVAGMLMALVILLPDREPAVAGRRAPPQPRRRTEGAPQPAREEHPAPAQEHEPPPSAETSQSAAARASGIIEWDEPEAQAAPAEPPHDEESDRSVEEEVLSDKPESIPELDMPDSRFDDTGDEDVVYGNGRISEDAVWDFVQNYPDSAVKFLYRKSLDNKPLPPVDEDIYRKWEMRGLTRSKVREVVLELMGWQSLPDDFPHNIWRAIRDQIFEMRSRQ